jgi:hypothetical protein
MKSDIFGLLFRAIFIAILLFSLFRLVKYRAFKAATFGGHVEGTVGAVMGARQSLGNVKLRVHVLSGGGPERAVGIELVATTFASYRTLPISLSVSGAETLIRLLQTAVRDTHQLTQPIASRSEESGERQSNGPMASGLTNRCSEPLSR